MAAVGVGLAAGQFGMMVGIIGVKEGEKSSWKDGKYAPGESDTTRGSFDPKGTGTQRNNLPKFGEAPPLNKPPKQQVPLDLVKLPKPSKDIWQLPTVIFKDSASKNTSGGKTFWLPSEIYKELLSQKVINGDGYFNVSSPSTISRFEAMWRSALSILRVFYGEDIEAYFNNPMLLVTEFNQVAGRNLFGTFQQLLKESKFDEAVRLIWSLED
jgi:hypothetical protein